MHKIHIKQLLTIILPMFLLANNAEAESNVVNIQIHGGRFSPSEINIADDTKVQFIIENLDDTPEEFESYDLNREVLINANSKTSFYIGPLSPGIYKFEGEFSPETAQGIVRVR
jgi:hypothetical protein